VDSDNHLTSIVWIHPQCLQLLKSSPDCLIVDCTFKTNRYNFPLLNLVGSNGHNRTTHLGIALLRHQDEAAFSWVLVRLHQLFEDKGIKIRFWVSDRDLAFVNALNETFGDPRILICRWHMNKDVLGYLRSKLCTPFSQRREGRQWVDNDSTKEYMELYFALMSSPTVADYEKNLKACEMKSATATSYLCRYWLNDHKERLVSCFIDNDAHFGLTVTSKAEGAHRVLKEWLRGSRADILTLFQRLDAFYNEHIVHHTITDAQNSLRLRADCREYLFSVVFRRITRYAMALTVKQLTKARDELRKQQLDGTYEFPRCHGRYRASLGLPCWHTIADLELHSKPLQPADFDVHWWLDRSESSYITVEATPREPQTITRARRAKRSHRKGDSTRRDPSLFERLDNNNPASPPSSAPARMRTQPQSAAIVVSNPRSTPPSTRASTQSSMWASTQPSMQSTMQSTMSTTMLTTTTVSTTAPSSIQSSIQAPIQSSIWTPIQSPIQSSIWTPMQSLMQPPMQSPMYTPTPQLQLHPYPQPTRDPHTNYACSPSSAGSQYGYTGAPFAGIQSRPSPAAIVAQPAYISPYNTPHPSPSQLLTPTPIPHTNLSARQGEDAHYYAPSRPSRASGYVARSFLYEG